MVETSWRPGWPPHSKPTIVTMSAPSFSALTASLTLAHLCMWMAPAPFMSGMYSSGLRPAVSMIRTPSSSAARSISSWLNGLPMGIKVMFTAKGLSVRDLVLRISSFISSMVSKAAAGMIPRPPASATAATISERVTHCMHPQMTGYSIPKSFVTLVANMVPSYRWRKSARAAAV